ncbi:MAG: hypothetical protein A2W17_05505 [Planctomycetes bacterium RBG_16_41_13]|nr:MAG: hypothetical protein A2W17_05505 [Planctomycetes bacterium RBG_16_41_13]
MDRIVLTGVGPLTPIGKEKEDFWNAVVNNFPGIKKITKFMPDHEFYGGEINDINFDEYIPGTKFRRAAEISKFTMSAAKMAMDDAQVDSSNIKNLGLVVGLTHGALNYTQSYHELLVTEGPESASPILFSDSILNAPAGNTSICLGIHGPVHTLIGGSVTTIRAIMLAVQLLATKKMEKSVIASAEELNEFSLYCYYKLGIKTLSEGAGALLIEPEDTKNNQDPYCYISGFASQTNPSNLQSALEESVETALKKANLKAKDVDLLMTSPSFPKVQPLDAYEIPMGSLDSITGNAFAVSTIWNIILSALCIRHGAIPSPILKNSAPINNEIRNVMICATEREGVAGVLILSKIS